MSTPSLIGYKEKGIIYCVYCHFDGYLSDLGVTLMNYYNCADRAKALVELGALSFVGKRLSPDPGEKHDDLSPNFDITFAYHRDRGEDYQTPRVYNSVRRFISTEWVDYFYLFDMDAERIGWYVYYGYGAKEFLKEALQNLRIGE